MSEKLSLVIDTDTASDDAVALVLAALEPDASIRAVTVVAGNVPLSQGVRNALVTLDLVDRPEVPVHAGLPGPLLRPLQTAQHVHGHDGMSGVTLPPPSRAPDPGHAVDVLRQIAAGEPGLHTLVTLGPLSNIAAALLIDRDLLSKFRHTFMMAGAPDAVGNVHPVGEYNAWADPEAAGITFGAAGGKTMVGWNISRAAAVVQPDERARLAAAGPIGQFIVGINEDLEAYCREENGIPGFDLPDPVTMAVALDPAMVIRAGEHHVSVGRDDAARGGTFVDWRKVSAPPNVRVIWEVSKAAFKQRLLGAAAYRPRPAA